MGVTQLEFQSYWGEGFSSEFPEGEDSESFKALLEIADLNFCKSFVNQARTDDRSRIKID